MQVTIQDYLEIQANELNTRLEEWLDSYKGQVPEPLHASMVYSLLAGGKRIRPALLFATVESFGGELESAYPFGCAVEVIHTYSLIHDDLPCMDDDDYRRGKLTNHKVYGEAIALLAGDALLTEAFGLLASGIEKADLSVNTALKIWQDTVKYAGVTGMIGGQVDDMLGEKCALSLAQLKSIHLRKTAGLITLPVRIGGYLTHLSDDTLEMLSQFAITLGLIFQIQDDILDIEGNSKHLGKTVGSDLANQKATYPALMGLDESKHQLAQLFQVAMTQLEQLPLQTEHLRKLTQYLIQRDR